MLWERKKNTGLEELRWATARKAWRKSPLESYVLGPGLPQNKTEIGNYFRGFLVLFLFFWLMDLSLNSVNVCSEAALSEMQTGGFAAAIEHRHLPPSSLPQSNAELGEHVFFLLCGQSGDCEAAWRREAEFVVVESPCPRGCGVIPGSGTGWSLSMLPMAFCCVCGSTCQLLRHYFSSAVKQTLPGCILRGLRQCFFSWAVPSRNCTCSQLSTSHSWR